MITYLMVFVAVSSGVILGKIPFGKFKLGSSGALFTGILIGWIFYPHISDHDLYSNILSVIFRFSLALFITSVGLIASSYIKEALKYLGLKLLFLSFIITFTGFALTTLLIKISPKNPAIIGIFSGALTSSPGLASALEESPDLENYIIQGYSFGYIPGVLAVIFSMYAFAHVFKSRINQKLEYNRENSSDSGFDFAGFFTAATLGIAMGAIPINIFGVKFKLGMTGGILILALILGNFKKILGINFIMDKDSLRNLQELGLLLFLTSIGLKSGSFILNNINFQTLQMMFLSFLVAFLSIVAGFVVGKYMFKIDPTTLAGAICGGMTSTPGLGAAIDAMASPNVIAGYGATYPFALFFMVVFNKILLHLLS